MHYRITIQTRADIDQCRQVVATNPSSMSRCVFCQRRSKGASSVTCLEKSRVSRVSMGLSYVLDKREYVYYYLLCNYTINDVRSKIYSFAYDKCILEN